MNFASSIGSLRTVAVGVALCCGLLFVGGPSLALDGRQVGVVATQERALRVREAPALDARVIAAAGHQERVVVLEKSSDGAWLRIETVHGEVGWVSAQYINLLVPDPPLPQQDHNGFALFLIAVIGFAVFLFWRWKTTSAAASEGVQDNACAAPPPLEARSAQSEHKTALRFVIPVALAVAVIGWLIFFPEPRKPPPDNVVPVPEPSSESPQVSQAPVEDVEAWRDVLGVLEPDSDDTPRQREAKELERRWVQYLEGIQSQRDYANWSDKPCELYARNHRRSAREAVDLGLATIQAQGMDLQTVTLRVTFNSPSSTSIIVPVGTLFTSTSAGKQNMMAATSIRFNFAPVHEGDTHAAASPLKGLHSMLNRLSTIGAAYADESDGLRLVMFRPPSGPRTDIGNVQAYCVNRWLDVPDSNVAFSVSYPDEDSPLPRLLSCLDTHPAKHKVKQFAVWMISDNLINLTPAQLEEQIFEDLMVKTRHMTGVQLAEKAKQRNPFISEEQLRKVRGLSSAQVEQLRSIRMRQLAQKDARAYNEVGPLLQACGFDTSNSAFFRQ